MLNWGQEVKQKNTFRVKSTAQLYSIYVSLKSRLHLHPNNSSLVQHCDVCLVLQYGLCLVLNVKKMSFQIFCSITIMNRFVGICKINIKSWKRKEKLVILWFWFVEFTMFREFFAQAENSKIVFHLLSPILEKLIITIWHCWTRSHVVLSPLPPYPGLSKLPPSLQLFNAYPHLSQSR